MTSEKRTIELTVISATDLKKAKLGRAQHCYAVAYVYPSHKKTTPVDNYGGVNPIWNSTLTLTCEESLLHQTKVDATVISVEIFCHGFLSGTKLVGRVSITLRDVLREGKLMAFQVVQSSGKPQGTLNVSVKLGEKLPLGQYEDLSATLVASYSSTSEIHNQDQQAPSTSVTRSFEASAPPQVNPPTENYGASASSVEPSTHCRELPTVQVYPPAAGSSNYPSTLSGQSCAVEVYPPTNQNYRAPLLGYPPTSNSANIAQDPVMGYPAFAPRGPDYNPYVYFDSQPHQMCSRRERHQSVRAHRRRGLTTLV